MLVHSRVLPVAWAITPALEKWEEKQWTIVARLLDQARWATSGVAGAALTRLCTQLDDNGLVGPKSGRKTRLKRM